MWQKYWHQCCFIACLLVIVSQKVTCHVALTFPPARQYDLDFLDSVRTKPPCGMPKGKSFKKIVVFSKSISTTLFMQENFHIVL